MAIYQLFETSEKRTTRIHPLRPDEAPTAATQPRKENPFSGIAARLLFLLLFVGDLLWTAYSGVLLIFSGSVALLTFCKAGAFLKLVRRAWLSLKRALICGLSLLVALFSPSFGIMVACTYFLMYDKEGMDEVVPTSIQAHFKSMHRNR